MRAKTCLSLLIIASSLMMVLKRWDYSDYDYAQIILWRRVKKGSFESVLPRLQCILYRVPTLPGKLWKPGILSFTFPCLERAQKSGKTWKFNSKPGRKKTWILKIWCFHINFSRCLCPKNHLYLIIYVISKLSIPMLWFEAKLTWDSIAFTWK